MSAILLAPYNDSMRLGAGYNSFLQTPCLANAVDIQDTLLSSIKNGGVPSQTVAYSASCVDKMSEVVRSMNISAGSAIRAGSVTASGGGTSIDEIKFSESDLNIVLSVKVVNQTQTLRDHVKFNSVPVETMDSKLFHETYGDTFISGFVEGGDLHGIISIRALEVSKKSELTAKLKGQLNSLKSEWSPGMGSQLSGLLKQAEVTISVNYSGGGIITPSDEEWSIDSLIRAAAAFPSNVALCPQRTYAILTRYNTIPNFVEWAHSFKVPISIRRYESIQRFTSELLDIYTEYKSNLLILNDIIKHSDHYNFTEDSNKLKNELGDMLTERTANKAQMAEIVAIIETLNAEPEKMKDIKIEEMTPPELFRARLPEKKGASNPSTMKDLLRQLESNLPLGDTALNKTTGSDSLARQGEDIAKNFQIESLESEIKKADKTADELRRQLNTEIDKSKTALAAEKERSEKDITEEKQRSARAIAAEQEKSTQTLSAEKERSESAITEEKEQSKRAVAAEKDKSDKAIAAEKEQSKAALAAEKERSERALAAEKEQSKQALATEKESSAKAVSAEKLKLAQSVGQSGKSAVELENELRIVREMNEVATKSLAEQVKAQMEKVKQLRTMLNLLGANLPDDDGFKTATDG